MALLLLLVQVLPPAPARPPARPPAPPLHPPALAAPTCWERLLPMASTAAAPPPLAMPASSRCVPGPSAHHVAQQQAHQQPTASLVPLLALALRVPLLPCLYACDHVACHTYGCTAASLDALTSLTIIHTCTRSCTTTTISQQHSRVPPRSCSSPRHHHTDTSTPHHHRCAATSACTGPWEAPRLQPASTAAPPGPL